MKTLRPTKQQVIHLEATIDKLQKELAHHSRKAGRAEYLLRMAIRALTSSNDDGELGDKVINLYMEELQNDWQLMVTEWIEARWLDTKFIPKFKETK